MTIFRSAAAHLITVTLTVAPLAAQTQTSDEAQDSVLVEADQGSGNSGRVAINLAAGSQNQQASAATIALGNVASQAMTVDQASSPADATDRVTSMIIGPAAFSNNSGMVSLNFTAGNQNQSANLAALSISNNGAVSDLMLAQASAPTEPSGASAQIPDSPNDSVVVDDTALGGNSGLVQMNLIGGERNTSGNTFALSISRGQGP
ncbi:MAG: hypothetical protein HC834_08655 [Rhodospirillales bacterium]|nr:hypothetical protein [Rhodospirillales bacterium]